MRAPILGAGKRCPFRWWPGKERSRHSMGVYSFQCDVASPKRAPRLCEVSLSGIGASRLREVAARMERRERNVMERIRSAVFYLWPVLSFRRGEASACATHAAVTGAKRSRLQAERLEEAYFTAPTAVRCATERATTATPHDAWPVVVLTEIAVLGDF
jgi:hypothetical protein